MTRSVSGSGWLRAIIQIKKLRGKELISICSPHHLQRYTPFGTARYALGATVKYLYNQGRSPLPRICQTPSNLPRCFPSLRIISTVADDALNW